MTNFLGVLSYAFIVRLEYLTAKRISAEKANETIRAIYSHHLDPMREIKDCIRIQLFVQLPETQTTEEENKIIQKTMDAALREFDYRVTRELGLYHEQLKEQKNKDITK